jgi:phage terminase large subunit-like protein
MLKNGMRYKIVASNSGGARGLSSDLVILDELRQQKTYDAYSALVFTMNARPNSQFWGISNAGDHYSIVLNAMRQRALDKIEKGLDDPLCFMEWSASPHRKLSDIEGWKEANPALGRTISVDAIKARLSDPPEIFQTEVLCQWVVSMNSAFSNPDWNSCMQPNLSLKPDRPTWLGVEISPERNSWALTGSQILEDKSIAVGLMEYQEQDNPIDDLFIASRIAEWAKHYDAEEVIANRFTGDSVVAKLKQAGINANIIKGSDYYTNCDQVLSAMSGGRLAHSNQPELTASVNSCIKKSNDTGAWYVMRRKPSTAAISMILAVGKAEQYGSRSVNQDIVVA